MNVSVEEHEPFQLDFEHRASEWKKDEVVTNSSDNAIEDNACESVPEDIFFFIMSEMK